MEQYIEQYRAISLGRPFQSQQISHNKSLTINLSETSYLSQAISQLAVGAMAGNAEKGRQAIAASLEIEVYI